MFAVVLFALAGGSLAAAVIAGTMFIRVALWPEVGQPAAAAPPLPLLSGQPLHEWAQRRSASLTAAALAARARPAPVELARSIEAEASRVISHALPGVSADRATRCPDGATGHIGVTLPEVLAIVDDLERNRPQAVAEVQARAHENAVFLATGMPGPVLCPLLGDDGRCLSFEARPVQCRGTCAECVALGAACATGVGGDGDFGAQVARGFREGLARGLIEGGLDGQVYELNSSLARALRTTDAAARWADGEPVFAGCAAISQDRSA